MVKIPNDLVPTNDDFADQYREAKKRGKEKLKDLPKATSAHFDKKSQRLVFEMQNGVALLVPIHLIQGLAGGSAKLLSDFQLLNEGTQIHWDKLDVQFYIQDLLRGIFGTPNWMRSLSEHLSDAGRKGGSRKSEVKGASSRVNGAKGGRPPRKIA